MSLGYKNPVLFDRHAVGGEYGAGYKMVGRGKARTVFIPEGGGPEVVVDERQLTDSVNAAVFYHNPYDNVPAMARHFFGRCLEAKVTPYVVTKKTVFKWQEGFWQGMKKVFDAEFKDKFVAAGLLKNCRGELTHFLSDVATMQLVRWSSGGFGMCAHNYDGDVLTDEIAQIHRSPGFLTSVLNGVKEDGSIIKEFEASHGTITDMWHAHLRGEETSLNPLSMMEALIGAMIHSAKLHKGDPELITFAKRLQSAIHTQMTTPGKASRDLSGPSGLKTEDFVQAVRDRLDGKDTPLTRPVSVEDRVESFSTRKIDHEKVKVMFDEFDGNGDGTLSLAEFTKGLEKLGVAPLKE
jgi:isocitrate dehydrogenase